MPDKQRPWKPGPWYVTSGGGDYDYGITTVALPPPSIALVRGGHNATLAAASPELYEALEEMVRGMDEELGSHVVDVNFPLARAALNKANPQRGK